MSPADWCQRLWGWQFVAAMGSEHGCPPSSHLTLSCFGKGSVMGRLMSPSDSAAQWASRSKAMNLCHCSAGAELPPRLPVPLCGRDPTSTQEHEPGRFFAISRINRTLTQGINLSWQARDPASGLQLEERRRAALRSTSGAEEH